MRRAAIFPVPGTADTLVDRFLPSLIDRSTCWRRVGEYVTGMFLKKMK